METQNGSRYTPTDAAFAHIDGINMGVAMDLLGQVIARLSATIEGEENVASWPNRRHALSQKRAALCHCQQGLRSENVVAVQAVFEQYGRGQK